MGDSAADFLDYVKEQLAPIHGLTGKRFFGGTGLVSNGVQFGTVMDNTLYFVVDDATRPHYEQLGSACFSYETKKGRVDVKRYFEVPALEEPEQLLTLAQHAIGIARRSKGAKSKGG